MKTKRIVTRKLFERNLIDGRVLIGEISYDKGGTTLASMMGYASGPEQRGYYLRVRREEIKDGYRMFALGDGKKMLLQEALRFSANELARIEPTENQIEKLCVGYPCSTTGVVQL